LRAFAGEHLARYKLPRRLELVPALPRNATGKILKYQLRTMLAERMRPTGAQGAGNPPRP
ncbi:MAG TPA: 2-aminobenzoate-CoA ligase, partial [Roseiarcus sp.]|nr:2-aminobenzoate-CoA ligase [Roseiarcus sp.]